MAKFSLADIKEFQMRAAIVLERGEMQHHCGLCFEIKWAFTREYPRSYPSGGFSAAYAIMARMDEAYKVFYGKYGELTETRILVLIFITTMSAKELREMVNA